MKGNETIMGVFRLILSIWIVIFHSSTYLGTIGYSAVFGFYLMSGYAVTFVLENKYKDQTIRFWINRILKIYPSYLFILLLSMGLYYAFGNEVLVYEKSEKLFTAALDIYTIKAVCSEIFLGYKLTGNGVSALCLNGFPTFLPQAWTHSVQFIFYLTAPFLVKIWRKNKLYYFFAVLVSFIYPCYTYVAGLDFPTYRYRSVFGSYFVFLLGGLIYFYGEKIRLDADKYRRTAFLFFNILYFSMFAFDSRKQEWNEVKIWVSVIVEIIIILLSQRDIISKEYDRICSALSAGIYLAHMAARAILLVLCSKSVLFAQIAGFSRGGGYEIVVLILMISFAMAFILYFLVDKQIEQIRRRVCKREK